MVAPVTEKIQPAAIRQAKIKDHRRHAINIRPVLRLGAVGGELHREIGSAQALGEAAAKFGIIFDKQQAHDWQAPFCCRR